MSALLAAAPVRHSALIPVTDEALVCPSCESAMKLTSNPCFGTGLAEHRTIALSAVAADPIFARRAAGDFRYACGMATLVTELMIDELVYDPVPDSSGLDLDELLALEDVRPDPDVARERSLTAERWATGDEFTLESELLRAVLFSVASFQASLANDPERALRLARLAVTAGEAQGDLLVLDVRVALYGLLRAQGLDQEAAELEASMRRRLPDELESFDEMADALQALDDTGAAERWYAMGIRFAETNGLTDDFEYGLLIVARSELRERLGKPQDEYDVLAEGIVDEWDEELLPPAE